ncbi:MAG TPA: discoidin domain-containing protein, partial [Verrucomicrobiales bacterium]|nr:discoidin domain-containing protein [Verrucomicrobiales bacterium]
MHRPAAHLLTVCLLLLAGACSQQDGDSGGLQTLTDYFSSEVKELTEQINEQRKEFDPLPDIPYNLQQTDRIGFRTKPVDAKDADKPFRPSVLLDLGSKQMIDSVVLVPADAGFGAGFGFPVRFRVEVSEDLAIDEDLKMLVDSDEDVPNPRNYPVVITPPKPAEHLEARYVRITATRPWNGGGQAVFALGEILVLQGGRNLAAGLSADNIKVTNYGVEDSLETPPSWGRANLVDGQSVIGLPEGRQRSTHAGYQSLPEKQPESTRWVKIDLGRDAPLNEIRVFPARSKEFPSRLSFGFPGRFRVEIASDADPGFSQPVVVADNFGIPIPDPLENPVSIRVPGTLARYVKFTASNLDESFKVYLLALSEMQVFSGGENIALGASVIAQNSRENDEWSTKYLTDGFTSRRNILPWP